MKEFDINYFIEKENEGVIFGKISKSSREVTGKGGFLSYEKGKVFKGTDGSGLTIEPLDVAFHFFHYGDQLTIVSFTELAKNVSVDVFLAVENSGNKGCIQVPAVYVKEVLSLNDKSTIDLFRNSMSEEDFMATANLAKDHRENHGCNEGAVYVGELYKEMKNK